MGYNRTHKKLHNLQKPLRNFPHQLNCTIYFHRKVGQKSTAINETIFYGLLSNFDSNHLIRHPSKVPFMVPL